LALLLVGLLLIVSGVLEMLETFRADDASVRSTYLGGELSILAGILLLSTPELVLKGVTGLVAGSLLLDGLGKGIAALGARGAGTAGAGWLATGLVNVAWGLMLATGWPVSGWAVLGTVVGIRMLTNGWLMLLGRPTQPDAAEPPPEAHPDARLRLPPHPA